MHISRFSTLLILPAFAVASAIPKPEPTIPQIMITPAPEAPIATPAPVVETILSAQEGQPQLE